MLERVSFFQINVDQIIHAIENFAGGASRIPAGENQRMMEGRQRRNQHRNRNFTFISGMKDLKNIIATSLERLSIKSYKAITKNSIYLKIFSHRMG